MQERTITGSDAILFNDANSTRLPNLVDDTSIKADEYGNKYIKAGTLLENVDGKQAFTDRDSGVVLTPATKPENAQGVLLHDINIKDGAQYTSVIIQGDINLNMVSEDVKASFYSNDNLTKLKSVLPRITFINRY